VALAIFVAALGATASAAPFCAVTGLEGGTASVLRAEMREALSPGVLAGTDGAIETGPGTRLQVTCDDGTIVTVGPDSRVDLSDLLSDSGQEPSVIVQLLEGIAGFVASEPEGADFEVHTPVAVAAVRSTEWLVEHAQEAGTSVFVRSGSVAVSNAVETFVLQPGEGITVARDSVLRPLARWGRERIDRSNGALGFGWD
jgi:hypothetical protein